MQALPDQLSNLQQLQLLNVDNNDISAVPSSILSGCTSLKTFTLIGCPITIKVRYFRRCQLACGQRCLNRNQLGWMIPELGFIVIRPCLISNPWTLAYVLPVGSMTMQSFDSMQSIGVVLKVFAVIYGERERETYANSASRADPQIGFPNQLTVARRSLRTRRGIQSLSSDEGKNSTRLLHASQCCLSEVCKQVSVGVSSMLGLLSLLQSRSNSTVTTGLISKLKW